AVYDSLHYDVEMIAGEKQLEYWERYLEETFRARGPETRSGSARAAYAALGVADWSNLPGTLEEVESIQRTIRDAETLTGKEVSEAVVKQMSDSGALADYRILHFATHGLVVPVIPELSAIVLSQTEADSSGEDGYLRMGEITELKLAADFVNLSACETGLGRVYGGEGVVGLTQAFLIAGANGLSVSLWQVADEATARFMEQLYKRVEQGMSYPEAMAAVKRSFINGEQGGEKTHPFFWAPFVYYGD
ncbi:CHAT domain-containing protein, partial [bacterium]|nr:CHAT domain-containing protein [bacterium]